MPGVSWAQSPNGPHAVAIEEHTRHKAGSSGNQCVGCQIPRIETELADVNARSHTFRFISPAEAERLKMSNSSSSCHSDKTAAWATAALKSWKEFLPGAWPISLQLASPRRAGWKHPRPQV